MFGLVPFRKNNTMMNRGDYIDNFFDDFFDDDMLAPMNITTKPFKVDVKENENQYTVEADLPGVEKDALNVDYNNNYLTISAKREDKFEDKNNNYVRREIRSGKLKRGFYIDNVDESKIDASFNNGVLKITLPKTAKTKPDSHNIEIH